MTLRSRFWRVTRRRRRRCWWLWMPNAHSSNAASSSSALRCMLPPEIACAHVAHTFAKSSRAAVRPRWPHASSRKQDSKIADWWRTEGCAQRGLALCE